MRLAPPLDRRGSRAAERIARQSQEGLNLNAVLLPSGRVSEPDIVFTDLRVSTRNGPRNVLLAVPTREIVLGRDRLEQTRAGTMHGEVDRAIISAVEARGDVHALLFRAKGVDADARWHLADDLSKDEATELTVSLLRGQVEMFCRLARHSMFAFTSADFGPREVAAYERAAQALISDLEQKLVDARGVDAARLRLELWLLERQAAWSSRPFASFVDQKLPSYLVAAERQRKTLLRMLDALHED